MESKSFIRRSNRIAKQVPLVVRWQPPGRDIEDDPAQTVLLSKHGCSFTCPVPLKLGSQVYVLDPARGKGARARVVYRGLARAGQEATVAVEFPDTADFWNQSFLAQPH